jgi:hypothetical protein
MESFIVRVYRRAVGSHGEPVGTVERVGGGERVAFTNRDELLARLFRLRKPRRKVSEPLRTEDDA